MTRLLAWFGCGLVFGLGLCLSEMVNPLTVQAFLDVTGSWDPTLVFVLGGAVTTAFIGYRLVFRRGRPLLADRFNLPTSRTIDTPLIGGAVLFGVGWGLLGYCPGPAIVSLAGLHPEPLLFVVAMVAGNLLAGRLR
jgi:uncharacterized protein